LLITFRPLDHFTIDTIVSINFCLYSSYEIDSSFLSNLLLFIITSSLDFDSEIDDDLEPSIGDWITESLSDFSNIIIEENLGSSFGPLSSLLSLFFSFLVISNILGALPYSGSSGSHILVTFYSSLIFFFFFNYYLIYFQKFFLFELFLPSGTPLVIAPFLIFIELVSYIARVFSLSIRLFANMMAGHTLLGILSNFVLQLFLAGGLLTLLSLFPFIIVILIGLLEYLIGFLQSYVYLMLICLYFNDIFHLH